MHILAGLLACALLVFLGFALFNDNPLGGEPSVRVAIAPSPSAQKADSGAANSSKDESGKASPAIAAPSKAAASPSGQQTVTIIDGSRGTRQEVPIGAGGDAGPPSAAPANTPAADSANPASSPAPALMNGVDQRLLENSRYGMVPIAAAGLKPSQVYAGGDAALRARALTTPSIAIVMTGMGVGAAKTSDATMKLPGAVTLAFTPYGTDPGKMVERARSLGHEILLQVPMEPFDYPDNDPGPRVLLTSLPQEENIDRLMWHMSRFQGYVGLTNFMGGRFIGSDTALQPIIKEASRRGLVFLDDGSAIRSVASTLAEGQAMPFARADATLDTVPTPAEIDRALSRLELIAKQRGVAVGVASALPVSIDRIAAWAKTLESRGIVLVPLTSAMLKAKSS
jgi:polysaccharide deacetylase 2 family uncharacterized protein YibQ